MRTTLFAVLAAGLLVPGPDVARAQTCAEGGRPNVVLIVLDDLGWMDFPFVNPPIRQPINWTAQSSPPKSRRIQSPTYNRLDARLFASATGALGTYVPPDDYTPLDDGFTPSTSAWQPYTVQSVENATSYTNPAAETCGTCDPATDVLPGHGGLRRIAEEGQTFTRFYASAALCLPTRASILTGKQGTRTGANSNGDGERIPGGGADDFPSASEPADTGGAIMTLPRLLGRHGYHTGLVGKWHVTTAETDLAGLFDDAIYSDECCRPYFATDPMTCAGQDHAGELCATSSGPWHYYRTGPAGTDAGCSDAPVTATHTAGCNFSVRGYADMATEFLDHFATYKDTPGADADRFFLYVAFNAIHDAHRAPDRTEAHYTGNPDVARTANYWALLEEADAAIGRILAKLDAQGILNQTVVIVTGDQGPDGTPPEYGDPRLNGKKATIWEGGIRVPFMVRGCSVPSERYNDALASHLDLYRTVANLAGIVNTSSTTDDYDRYVADRDGVNLRSTMFAGAALARNLAYARHGDTQAVVSRRGLFRDLYYFGAPIDAGGVCGFVPHPTSTTDQLRLRQAAVRGASKLFCNPAGGSSTCTGAGSTACTVVGKRCVVASGTGFVTRTAAQLTCPFTTAGCTSGSESLARCLGNTDCPSGEVCREVKTSCNRCMTAAFKLRSSTALTNRQLYDLTTNPEEQADFDFYATTSPASTTECVVRESMRCFADNFRRCEVDEEYDTGLSQEPPACENGNPPSPPDPVTCNIECPS